LVVLFSAWRGGMRVLTCAAGSGRVTVPESWTDRGPAPAEYRLSVEGLAGLAALVAALQQQPPGEAAVVRTGGGDAEPAELAWWYGPDCRVHRDGDGVGEHGHRGVGGRR
jgi:hypothetical protein